MPECWATCELRFDHRQRKQDPRSSFTATLDTPSRRSHRELPENISHAMPRQGRSVGTDAGVCLRCEAERRAIVVRSDRCTAFAWQNKRFHRVPVVASFPGICGSSPFGGSSTAVSECGGLAQDHCRRHCAIIVGGIAPSLSEVLRHHCRKYCTIIAGSIARTAPNVLRLYCVRR